MLKSEEEKNQQKIKKVSKSKNIKKSVEREIFSPRLEVKKKQKSFFYSVVLCEK